MRMTVTLVGLAALFVVRGFGGCSRRPSGDSSAPAGTSSSAERSPAAAFREMRQDMVRIVAKTGRLDARAVAALRSTPRHEFVPAERRHEAYDAQATFPVEDDRNTATVKSLAAMIGRAEIRQKDRCLLVGAGNGYGAAVISMLCAAVYVLEPSSSVAGDVRKRLKRLGYGNVTIREGSPAAGWPGEMTFERIILLEPAGNVPETFIRQLQAEGRLVFPRDMQAEKCGLVIKDKNGEVERKGTGQGDRLKSPLAE